MIPLREVVLWLGVAPGIPTLIFVHTVYGIPICTLIFRNYYATVVPEELIEAGMMDGAGLLRTFRSLPADFDPRLRGHRDLAVHLVVERLPVRDLHVEHAQRADRDRTERPGGGGLMAGSVKS